MTEVKGIIYPIRKSVNGFFSSGDYLSLIKSSLMTIIMTRPGERVMESDFGCPLHTLSPNLDPDILQERARMMIAQSIKRWEKRVQVLDIKCILVPVIEGYDLNITVNFVDPQNMQNIHNLIIQIALGE